MKISHLSHNLRIRYYSLEKERLPGLCSDDYYRSALPKFFLRILYRILKTLGSKITVESRRFAVDQKLSQAFQAAIREYEAAIIVLRTDIRFKALGYKGVPEHMLPDAVKKISDWGIWIEPLIKESQTLKNLLSEEQKKTLYLGKRLSWMIRMEHQLRSPMPHRALYLLACRTETLRELHHSQLIRYFKELEESQLPIRTIHRGLAGFHNLCVSPCEFSIPYWEMRLKRITQTNLFDQSDPTYLKWASKFQIRLGPEQMVRFGVNEAQAGILEHEYEEDSRITAEEPSKVFCFDIQPKYVVLKKPEEILSQYRWSSPYLLNDEEMRLAQKVKELFNHYSDRDSYNYTPKDLAADTLGFSVFESFVLLHSTVAYYRDQFDSAKMEKVLMDVGHLPFNQFVMKDSWLSMRKCHEFYVDLVRTLLNDAKPKTLDNLFYCHDISTLDHSVRTRGQDLYQETKDLIQKGREETKKNKKEVKEALWKVYTENLWGAYWWPNALELVKNA